MTKLESRRSFITKAATATAGMSFGMSLLNACQFEKKSGTSKIMLKRNDRFISINLPVSDKVSQVEIRLFSTANNSIFEYSDVSPYAPQTEKAQTGEVFDPEWQEKEEMDRLANRELRFPVVDIFVKKDMEAVIEIDFNGPGEYCFNGNFYPKMLPIVKTIHIPANRVEHWENAMLLDPKTNAILSFCIASKVSAKSANVSFDFETLRDDWEGSIAVLDTNTKELIAGTEVSRDIILPQISNGSGVNRQRMIDSLSWATKYILKCKNTNPNSPTFGGHFLLYDLAAKTRLRSDWPWNWGPSARMLLKAAEIEGMDAGIKSEELTKEAVNIGLASLKQQIIDPAHPAFGLIKATIEPGTTRDCGFDNRATGADTLHLVGWGWMPLYKATKNPLFLEAADKVAEAIDKLMGEHKDKMIPQAFNLKKEKWDNNMFFETSMGMVGLAALYRETGQKKHRDIMMRFIEMLLNAFEREDGLWDAMFYKQTGKTQSCNYFTKSFGYCVDGLLAAHEADPEREYLEKAKKITEHVLKAQLPDGSWSVRLERPVEEVGVTDKGTALWAYLFIRLYKVTRDSAYLNAGLKALEWCMDHQYFGDDAVARGGIVGRSWPSGIIYRHWFDMVTTYTISFYGNALTEALSLNEERRM